MCEWCGHEHDQRALCTKRPTWGRRGFLALLGAAAVGAVVPLPAVAGIDWDAGPLIVESTVHYIAGPDRASVTVYYSRLEGPRVGRWQLLNEVRARELRNLNPNLRFVEVAPGARRL